MVSYSENDVNGARQRLSGPSHRFQSRSNICDVRGPAVRHSTILSSSLKSTVFPFAWSFSAPLGGFHQGLLRRRHAPTGHRKLSRGRRFRCDDPRTDSQDRCRASMPGYRPGHSPDRRQRVAGWLRRWWSLSEIAHPKNPTATSANTRPDVNARALACSPRRNAGDGERPDGLLNRPSSLSGMNLSVRHRHGGHPGRAARG